MARVTAPLVKGLGLLLVGMATAQARPTAPLWPATALNSSSTAGAGYEAANAVDGSSLDWHSKPGSTTDQWMTFDLGSEKPVDMIRFRSGMKPDTFGFPKTFRIETSENATGPWQLRMVLGLNASQQCCAEHANYTYDTPLRYDDRIKYVNGATWLADKTPTRYIRTFFYDIPTKYNTTGYNFSNSMIIREIEFLGAIPTTTTATTTTATTTTMTNTTTLTTTLTTTTATTTTTTTATTTTSTTTTTTRVEDCEYVYSKCTAACESGAQRTITVIRNASSASTKQCPTQSDVPTCQPGTDACPTTTTTTATVTTTKTTTATTTTTTTPTTTIAVVVVPTIDACETRKGKGWVTKETEYRNGTVTRHHGECWKASAGHTRPAAAAAAVLLALALAASV